VVVDARERRSDGDIHCFDVDVLDPAGVVVERWESLTVRAVRATVRPGQWVPALLGPHIERTLKNVLGGHRAVVVETRSGAAWGRGCVAVGFDLAASRRSVIRYACGIGEGRPARGGGHERSRRPRAPA